MKLELTIAGLCLLVDDDTDDAVYVLLPDASGHNPHGAYLVYSAASAISKKKVGRQWFDLTVLAAARTTKPEIPADVLDMTAVCSTIGDLPRASLEVSNQKTVGWAKLRGGELSVLSTQCCRIAGDKHFVASQVKWTIEADDLHSRLVTLGLLPGSSTAATFAGAGFIEVGLVHAEESAMAELTTLDDVRRLTDSNFAHYSSFYGLFSSGCTEVPGSCGTFVTKKFRDSPSVCMLPRVKAAP